VAIDVVGELENLALPAETSFEFERKLTDFVRTTTDQNELRESLWSLLADRRDLKPELRYAAFYALHILLRRTFQSTELGKLMDTWGKNFAACNTYPHLKSLYLRTRPGRGADAVHCASEANRKTDRAHAGILHNYAAALIEVEEQAATVNHERLRTADAALTEAIGRTEGEYARYFATQARLYSLLGRHSEAEAAVSEAIDKEAPGAEDYPIRIGEYQEIRLRIRFQQYRDQLEERVRKAVSRFEESRLEMVQLLGLLAAVVAFLVVTLEVAQNQTLDRAARLLVLMTGGILVVFAAFGFLLHERRWLRHLTVLAAGVGVIGFALYGWQSVD
jgi:hypothetical protein